MLIELGVINLICNLISYETKRSILEEGLLVAVACLLGGNYDCQQRFYNYILADVQNRFIVSIKDMIIDAFDEIIRSQIKRNELKMKKIGLDKKIKELENLTVQTKQTKVELNKLKEQCRLNEEDIKSTDYDETENPAAYVTNELTVRRAITDGFSILRFMQLLCENHNPNLQNILR